MQRPGQRDARLHLQTGWAYRWLPLGGEVDPPGICVGGQTFQCIAVEDSWSVQSWSNRPRVSSHPQVIKVFPFFFPIGWGPWNHLDLDDPRFRGVKTPWMTRCWMNQGGDTYLFDVIDAGGLVFEDSLEAWLSGFSGERGPRLSQNGKSPIAGWFWMEHPIKMDDNWGVPLFWETSIFGNKVALFCLFLPFSLWRPAAHEKNIDGLTTKWKKEVAYTVYIYI